MRMAGNALGPLTEGEVPPPNRVLSSPSGFDLLDEVALGVNSGYYRPKYRWDRVNGGQGRCLEDYGSAVIKSMLECYKRNFRTTIPMYKAANLKLKMVTLLIILEHRGDFLRDTDGFADDFRRYLARNEEIVV